MRTLDTDELTTELAQRAVTIGGVAYGLVVKDNSVNKTLRADTRKLMRLGRDEKAAAERIAALADADPPDEAAIEKAADEQEKAEERLLSLQRQIIMNLLRDADAKPPPAAALNKLDSAIVGKVFEFVLTDPLDGDRADDPTSPTANGGGTPPS